MEPYFNAAAVGKASKLNIAGAYALDFAGFENNPRTMYLAADMPLRLMNAYHGVGVELLNDQIGLFTHQRFAAQYAIKSRLFGGRISVGARLGLLSEKFDGSKLDLEDASDPAFSKAEVSGSAMDLGVGVYYTRGSWWAGLSAEHLTAPTVELGETNELKIDPVYYATGGVEVKLRNPTLTVVPSFLVRTDMVAWRADVTGRLVYRNDKKMLQAGLSYSPTNSVTVLLGGSFHGINVGYSYEVYTSNMSIGNGSHELFVGYSVDLNLYKKGKNKHKSVRFL